MGGHLSLFKRKPNEMAPYNIEGDLTCLGEDVLMEIIEEMFLPVDVQTFLSLNTKTSKLIYHKYFNDSLLCVRFNSVCTSIMPTIPNV